MLTSPTELIIPAHDVPRGVGGRVALDRFVLDRCLERHARALVRSVIPRGLVARTLEGIAASVRSYRRSLASGTWDLEMSSILIDCVSRDPTATARCNSCGVDRQGILVHTEKERDGSWDCRILSCASCHEPIVASVVAINS